MSKTSFNMGGWHLIMMKNMVFGQSCSIQISIDVNPLHQKARITPQSLFFPPPSLLNLSLTIPELGSRRLLLLLAISERAQEHLDLKKWQDKAQAEVTPYLMFGLLILMMDDVSLLVSA